MNTELYRQNICHNLEKDDAGRGCMIPEVKCKRNSLNGRAKIKINKISTKPCRLEEKGMMEAEKEDPVKALLIE